MSGSFWKFGQDYSIESPVTKLLNKAFVKIVEDNNDKNRFNKILNDQKSITSSNSNDDDDINNDSISKGNDQDEETLPTNEEDFKDYQPNLEVLDELLDDDELYTELMCSNFKLLIFLKYPQVLKKLIDYVTSEKILIESAEEFEGIVKSSINSDTDANNYEIQDNKKIEDLNQQVIIVHDNENSDETTIEENIKEGYEEIDTNTKNDSSSIASEETSVTIPPENEEQLESRRARMAAEILSADIWPIASTIMENVDLLEQLWSIMDHEPPLSIAASTYFMKINERLLDMDVNGIVNFILSKKSSVNRFLNHIENPALMDFLLKVISTDKQDSPTGIIKELKSQDLIPNLIDRLDLDKYSSSVQSASGDFLKAFVTLSANSNNEIALGIGPNELTRQLVSPDMIEKLIKIMLKGGTSLSNGVGIIIELIRKNNSDYDFIQLMYTTIKTHPPNDRDPIHLISLIKAFAKYMKDFEKMLLEITTPNLETPFGEIQPLGFERFKICELVAELLHCSNMALLNEPDGEKITSQRDLIRKEYLAKEDAEVNDEPIEATNSEKDEDINEKLEVLKINPTDENDAESSSDDNFANISAGEENENEVYPEDEIDNSADADKSIREKQISGDQLKLALKDTSIIRTIMDMFFKFKWNNFLHNVVFDIVQQIFNGPLKSGYNKFLLSDLLMATKLTDKIIKGDEDCEKSEKDTGMRLGYMGHLTLIAEEVAKFVEYIEEMKLSFTDSAILDSLNNEDWKTYMDTILADIREKYNTVLGDFVLEDGDMEELEGQMMDNLTPGHDINDEGDFFKNETHEEQDFYNEDDEIPKNEYLEGNGALNTESSYQYNKDSDNPNDQYGSEKNTSNDCSYYEYIDPSGHKTTLNINSFEDSPNTSANDDIKYVYQSQFELGKASKTHEILDNSEENDFIDYSPSSSSTGDDDEDDYMDPNDDGQSYAKPGHPLDNSTHLLSSNIKLSEEDLQDQDDADDLPTGDEYSSEDEIESEHDEKDNKEYLLYRTASRED